MKPKPNSSKEAIRVSVEKALARSAYAVTRSTGITMTDLVECGLEYSIKAVREGRWRPRTATAGDGDIG